ncbi:MAG: aminoacyl-tRNA hydrolase [Fidelibacterota bacterium]
MGLGNPDAKYSQNRHNFGFMVINHFARRNHLHFRKTTGAYLWCDNTKSAGGQGASLGLAKPLTYMNNSGLAARQLLNYFRLSPDNLLVVYDDLDLPLGRIRIRPGGAPGGHKGVMSISEHLQTSDFLRLRLGIGPQTAGVAAEDFVLADFRAAELPVVEKVINLCMDILNDFSRFEIEDLMNKYNRIDLREIITGDA